jgi:hypothetical protein
MMSDKRLRPLFLFLILAVLIAIYVRLVKQPPADRFFQELSNIMFLWGLTLLCVSLVYVTRFFGFLYTLQRMFRFSFRPREVEEPEPLSEEQETKRDASLVYASLLLIVLSIPIFYI